MSIITWILAGFLLITIIISVIAIRNLLYQIDILEENLQIYSNKITSVEEEALKYYTYYLKLLTETYQELQRIDKRGSFSSDDEVGFSFRVILKAIGDAKSKLDSLDIEEKDGTNQ